MIILQQYGERDSEKTVLLKTITTNVKTSKHSLVSIFFTADRQEGDCKGDATHGTSSPHPLHTVPLQFHAQRVVEGRELNQGEVADLLHVFRREVPNLCQSKPAFPNNEFLQ